ncbi:MAG: ATP-grasp domain-containing protein [Pirellulaceae bacterium]|nr:ATP-grasp domain-containing protein [Pirellulaceae bacterium]
MHVLIFPSCNEPGLEVIDALSCHPRIEVWGGSSFDLLSDPSRLLLGERHHELPALSSAGFRGEMRKFCKDHSIDFVFPTVDAVVAEMSDWTESFKLIGPSHELAELVLSKARVYDAVRDVVQVPRTFNPKSMELPAFAKPEIGSGSLGAVRLDDLASIETAVAAGLLVQEYLPGDEFTVDCISGVDGRLLACSVRQRLNYGGGIAKAATCLEHLEIERHVQAIAERLPLAGPWFAQFREDGEGTPRLLEVNARVGGSSGVTRLAGINIPLMAVLAFSGLEIDSPRRMASTTITRRLDLNGDVDDFDWVVWDLDDTLVHAGEVVDPKMVAWLYRFNQAGKLQSLVTRNVDPRTVISRTRLPDFFDHIVSTTDKLAAIRALLSEQGASGERVIMINDSGAEKILFKRELPAIRTIAPDAINVLRS